MGEAMENLKVIYMGTPDFSAELLEKLIVEGLNIVGVVTQTDALIGRKRVLTPSPVKRVALAHNIPVFTPERIRDDYAFIIDLQPDLILTFAYGQIVPKAVLDAPRIACLNFHGSRLPAYRGAAPIQMALMNGDRTTGVTLMEMVEEMDAGRIYGIQEFPIFAADNFTTLSQKMITASLCLVRKVLPGVISGENKGTPQDTTKVTYAPLLKRSDEYIHFMSDNITRVLGKIHSFIGAGVSVTYADTLLKIHEAVKLNEDVKAEIGTLFISDNNLVLQLLDGQIVIKSLQKAGKKVIDAKSFINGEQANLPVVLKGYEANDNKN